MTAEESAVSVEEWAPGSLNVDESEIINGWIIKLLSIFLSYRKWNDSASTMMPVDVMENICVIKYDIGRQSEAAAGEPVPWPLMSHC